jgi:hypothetical protein
VADAGFGDFAQVIVDNQIGGSFKLLRGFRCQFLTTYGEHIIMIWTNDPRHVLATATIVVSPPETQSRVVLEIPRQ